jgi:hypothetical protein
VATARNIADAPVLFGVGIGADVVMFARDVFVAIGLLRLLHEVDRRLALTATMLRLLQGASIAVNLVNLVHALGFARDAIGAGGTVLAGPAQATLDALERHALGYDAGLIAFGLSCIVLGRLLAASGAVRPVLAIGMSVTGLVYLAGSFAALAAPSLSAVIDPLYVIPFAVELSFALLLITRGLRPLAPAPARAVPVPA